MRSVGGTYCEEQIVNAEILSEAPFACQEIVGEAANFPHMKAPPTQTRGEFGGSQEPVPAMSAAGEPAQHIFGTEDREKEAFWRAIERRGDERAARPHERCSGAEERIDVGNVLDDLERKNGIEPLAACGQLLGAGLAIIDLQIGAAGVCTGDCDVGLRGVDAGHGRTEAPQWLGDQAAAAADVEDAQAVERSEGPRIAAEMRHESLADEAEARRIEPMQRRHRASGIPPSLRERGEPLDFRRVDAGRRVAHREYLSLIRMLPMLASLPSARVCMGALWGAIQPLLNPFHPRGLDG